VDFLLVTVVLPLFLGNIARRRHHRFDCSDGDQLFRHAAVWRQCEPDESRSYRLRDDRRRRGCDDRELRRPAGRSTRLVPSVTVVIAVYLPILFLRGLEGRMCFVPWRSRCALPCLAHSFLCEKRMEASI
jgi:hypothetical protein